MMSEGSKASNSVEWKNKCWCCYLIGGDKVSVTDSVRWNKREELERREADMAARLSEVRLMGLKVTDYVFLKNAHTQRYQCTQTCSTYPHRETIVSRGSHQHKWIRFCNQIPSAFTPPPVSIILIQSVLANQICLWTREEIKMNVRHDSTQICILKILKPFCVLFFQKDRESSVKSLPQQNVDSDIWVPDYLTPSWVCLPNNQPVLAIIQPGETTLEVLNTVCKVLLLKLLATKLLCICQTLAIVRTGCWGELRILWLDI